MTCVWQGAKISLAAVFHGGNAPNNRVAVPQPSISFGYGEDTWDWFFTEAQKKAGKRMKPPMGEVSVKGDMSDRLMFPFFVTELTVQGPARKQRGGLWAATNRCMGGAATCVKTINSLNRLLREYPGAPKVNNVAISIATDQCYGELYASWSSEDEQQYYMRKIGMYALGREDDFAEFCSLVQSILDWGKGQRLQDVQSALEFRIQEELKADAAIKRTKEEIDGSVDHPE
ncbi:hypothetical protein PG994_006576 [Apiospora phragmitis]|uniref:DUF7924 domain-containing protein n=1 Tax=Apiospora phragmitis TaxID=2905665 RepID=A0ABR1VFH5_9PEZI